MMQDTSYRQVIEPPSMPLDLRDTAFAGRIHEVDPQAVARLKAILAEKAATAVVKKPQKTAVSPAPRLVGNGFNNRLPKQEETKECEEMAQKRKASDAQVLAAHRRYALENMSAKSLAEGMGITTTPLLRQFQAKNLPVRGRNGLWKSDEDVARVLEVHGMEGSSLTGRPLAEPKTNPQTRPVETAVSPVTGNVSSDLPASASSATTPPPSTSPSTNGALELVAIADQLAAVQSLMEMAQAKSVQVSGTIRLNLVVEIEL